MMLAIGTTWGTLPAAAQVSAGGTVSVAAPTEGGLAASPRPKANPIHATAAPSAEPVPESAPESAPEAAAAPASAAAPVAPAPAAKPATPPRDPSKGAVTNLPIPRFVSLKGNEGNARRGPSLTHRIDWVFTTPGMPLRVTAEHENWRRVEDAEGLGGWVHYALLSGVRSAIITADLADFRMQPDPASAVRFQAERGVIGRLLACTPDWCRMNVQGERGWVEKSALWGVIPGEILE
jgi:SH3-like domain-containing protein